MPVVEALGAVLEKAAEGAVVTIDKTLEVSSTTAEKIGKAVENVREIPHDALEIPSARDFLNSKLEEIKFSTPEQLEATMDENLRTYTEPSNFERINSKEGLSDEEKVKLREETGWSDKIIDNLSSMEEAKIYMSANLIEARIGDKECLIRSDIDWEQKDSFGRNNVERAKEGLAPLDSYGKPLELHHIGQHDDSPLAELTMQEHRGKGNDTILHNKNIESEINRSSFGYERAEHWKQRSNLEGVSNIE